MSDINTELNQSLAAAMQERDPVVATPEHTQVPASADGLQQVDAATLARLRKIDEQSARIRAERESVSAERALHAQELKEYAEWKEARALAAEDPVRWAALGGFDQPDQFATALMEKGVLTPEKRELLNLKKELNEQKNWRNTLESQQKAEKEQALTSGAMSELKNFAAEQGEKYELVTRSNSYQVVLNHIKNHYLKTQAEYGEGEVLTMDQAFQAIEDQLDSLLSPVLESNKIRSRFVEPKAPKAGSLPPAATRNTPGTINQNMRSSAQQAPKLTERQRLELAAEELFKSTR